MKPHKHAELIKLWADGATIQFKASPYDKWVTLTDTPEWKTDMEYRVKPSVGLKPRDNQIRIELGFKTTHADERMLYCEDALGNWLDPIEQLAKFADAVRYDEKMRFFDLVVAKGYPELALECNREIRGGE